MEKSDAKRQIFIEALRSYPQGSVYYVDECGIDKYLYREYGYSPRGIPITGKISGRKFKRVNIVAAKCADKIVAPMMYGGTTDSILFEAWFERALLKSIPKQSVIVLDNATFHRKSRLRELSEEADCFILFLPPYSPDLNPIERFWAWLKHRLRNCLPLYNSLDDAIVECFRFV